MGILFQVVALGLFIFQNPVQNREFTYEAGGVKLKGYIAYDSSVEGKRPGVLVVHEWYGHNDYARKRADMLAELGYVALAVDMYGDGKLAQHPDDAGKFAQEVMSNIPVMRARFHAALEVLRNDERVQQENIAAIGYCFGGGVVLHMARIGTPLDGVVSFHGPLATSAPAEKGAVKAKILVCHGEDDSFVSEEAVRGFKEEMKNAGADYRFKSYEGAIHGFTNPASDEAARKYGLKVAYNAKADVQSWEDMKEFFKEIF